ncbi:cell wall hydrolase [Pantoea sp. A4]|uniref:cell wall hydrolase n=1 Tax=Pantoea sp. A4 TaxID=1225184 RepID=UPI00035F02D4|nr:cell wall hydrolase [Pantoea sp. A4]
MLAQSAMLCLALNIYHEARGEPVIGQVAVANVTMNRAEQDSSAVCSVVYAPKQFSWTLTKSPHFRPSASDPSWQRAQLIAKYAIQGGVRDVTRGSTHYHAQHVSPPWRLSMRRTVVIGNHIFYRGPYMQTGRKTGP